MIQENSRMNMYKNGNRVRKKYEMIVFIVEMEENFPSIQIMYQIINCVKPHTHTQRSTSVRWLLNTQIISDKLNVNIELS